MKHIVTKFEPDSNQMKWDLRFLALAQEVSTWSKDPSTKCGAVVVNRRKRVVSMGYNGFPEGMSDAPELYANRDIKYSRIVHAEINAFNEIGRIPGGTIYTWPFMTCDRCAVSVISKGIRRVVAPYSDNPRWQESFEKAWGHYQDAGVSLDLYMPSLLLARAVAALAA